MKKTVLAVFFGVFALSVAIAQVTGVPSRLRLQTLTALSSGVSSAALAAQSTAPTILLYETDAAANNGKWYLQATGEGLFVGASNDVFGASVNAIEIQRTGTTLDSVSVQGFRVPKAAWGYLNGFTCALQDAAQGNMNACTRVGAGQYTLSFTAFASSPHCTVTPTASLIAQTNTATTSTASVTLRDTAGTLTDGNFMAHCLGI